MGALDDFLNSAAVVDKPSKAAYDVPMDDFYEHMDAEMSKVSVTDAQFKFLRRQVQVLQKKVVEEDYQLTDDDNRLVVAHFRAVREQAFVLRTEKVKAVPKEKAPPKPKKPTKKEIAALAAKEAERELTIDDLI